MQRALEAVYMLNLVTTQVTTCSTLFLLPRPLGEGWGEGQQRTKYDSSMHRPLALTPALSQGERE